MKYMKQIQVMKFMCYYRVWEKRETRLFINKISLRSTTQKDIYMTIFIGGLEVDCEQERKPGNEKRLRLTEICPTITSCVGGRCRMDHNTCNLSPCVPKLYYRKMPLLRHFFKGATPPGKVTHPSCYIVVLYV